MNEIRGRAVIETLRRCGVTHFVLSPGSRCTPLTLAAAACDGAEIVVHTDERAAAYYAVGVARASGRPAALICTSGTAGANYMPAVAEAYNARLPLIVLTADRPPELQNCGANQTMPQQNLYGHLVRHSDVLACPEPGQSLDSVVERVADAYAAATAWPHGPVHVNCMFREPLSGSVAPAVEVPPPAVRASAEISLDAEAINHTAAVIDAAEHGVIIAGRVDSPVDSAAVLRLAEHLGWPLLPDIQSGLRLSAASSVVVPYADLQLVDSCLTEGPAPECLLRVGGSLVSKRFASLIERAAGHITIADHPEADDPLGVGGLRLSGSIGQICDSLQSVARSGEPGVRPAFDDRCIDACLAADGSLSEPGVLRAVSRLIPDGHGLFLANSMPIRDASMFAVADGAAVPVVANRGVSGIDGLLATAVGYAEAKHCPLTVVCGDLAALHDLNSLQLVANSCQPIIVVLLNNDGGGIFSFLPIVERQDAFERCFGTPHGLNFAGAAEMFGIAYDRPSTPAVFEIAYRACLRSSQPSLLEICTDRAANAQLHRRLFEAAGR
jgi:2-succinyl-5-enolpyruvyl-6-hydroxy-3-cyclohexene-1-carboxylate synthase